MMNIIENPFLDILGTDSEESHKDKLAWVKKAYVGFEIGCKRTLLWS